MKDSATLRERGKVTLVPDEPLERIMPLRVAIVDVNLTDGTHLTQRVDDVRGTLKNPMTRDEIVAKAHDLIAPILGTAQCANLIEKVLNVDRVKNIRELRPLLQLAQQ
jgi:2-methylcitrate dehydratase PrpD